MLLMLRHPDFVGIPQDMLHPASRFPLPAFVHPTPAFVQSTPAFVQWVHTGLPGVVYLFSAKLIHSNFTAMKKFCIILIALFMASGVMAQSAQPCSSCLPEGITFSTQAQIDNFQSDYPGCTIVEGDVYIEGYDIINLNGLSVLTSIGGMLSFYSDGSLTSLTGLEGLTSIGEHLVIITTDISSMAGLDNLISVGGNLQIYENYSLTSLTGLENLDSIGSLAINSNDSLSDLTGLEGLTSIGGDLAIWQEASLGSMEGLQNVTSIGGELHINYNNDLINLSGLDNIAAASIENLTITYNPSLLSCEVQSICDYLASPVGYIDIHDNAPGCNSQAEVEATCANPRCLPEGILFSNQAEIDDFQANYPDCMEIDGDVTIKGNNITNLNGLSQLTSIGGNLEIKGNDVLTSLTGLGGLSSIGGRLSIVYNSTLTNLTGLDNVASIGGSLSIQLNNTLTDLTGLGKVIFIGSGLSMYYNSSLTSLSGLESLTSLEGGLYVSGNNSLTSLSGLENITFIGDGLYISDNDSLTSLTGLENVTSIGGKLDVYGNNSLTNLTGLENVTSIGGDLYIWVNDALISLTGLESLTSIEGVLHIQANDSLTSLTGLDHLTSVGNYLMVSFNWSLPNLTGLESLISIGGYLNINYNNTLSSLTGIDNIAAGSITDLSIHNNYCLSNCDVQSICDYLASPNGTIDIHNNNLDCNSEAEIEETCETMDISEMAADEGIRIYPNPSASQIVLTFTLNEPSRIKLEVLNAMGQVVAVIEKSYPYGEQQITWNIENLPAGLYFYRLTTNVERQIGVKLRSLPGGTGSGKLMIVR